MKQQNYKRFKLSHWGSLRKISLVFTNWVYWIFTEYLLQSILIRTSCHRGWTTKNYNFQMPWKLRFYIWHKCGQWRTESIIWWFCLRKLNFCLSMVAAAFWFNNMVHGGSRQVLQYLSCSKKLSLNCPFSPLKVYISSFPNNPICYNYLEQMLK